MTPRSTGTLSGSSAGQVPREQTRLAAFEAQRPRLLRLGYRMLGSLSEAEDIVQEAWLRWSGIQDASRCPPPTSRAS
jgi:DNA-directed RNA polymerase specialized sigma24 family protein